MLLLSLHSAVPLRSREEKREPQCNGFPLARPPRNRMDLYLLLSRPDLVDLAYNFESGNKLESRRAGGRANQGAEKLTV